MSSLAAILTSAFAALMNDCSSEASLMPLYEHGIRPALPVRGDPMMRWLEFEIPEDLSLENLTFRSTIIKDGKLRYIQDTNLCDEINCEKANGDVIRFSDYWETYNTTPGANLSHILEIVDEDENILLCSEAFIHMHPFEDRLKKIAAPSNVSTIVDAFESKDEDEE
jgi:hypothetical protein